MTFRADNEHHYISGKQPAGDLALPRDLVVIVFVIGMRIDLTTESRPLHLNFVNRSAAP